MSGSVVVLELNELCPPLLDRFISEGALPAFERLRSESLAYVTDAGEPQHHLNPWIQWVTAHTGVGFAEHGVFKLGDGHSLELPTLADAVSEAGRDVWLCGPMNIVPNGPVQGWWLPDPWNTQGRPRPAGLEDFASFVRANVQEHTNPAHRLSVGAYLRFVMFMARHGLSAASIAATLRQLTGERLGRRERWRRAALLDRVQWDLFEHHLRRTRPALATYFSNTTAHYQHLYWRDMDPEPFEIKPTEAERERFGDAIRFGYQEMDRLVGRTLSYADAQPDATVVLCTALSQQPYTQAEAAGGKWFYRPYDAVDLLTRLGVAGVAEVAPVMAEQFHVYLDDDQTAIEAERLLRSVVVDGRPAFELRRAGADVFLGCARRDAVPVDATLEVPDSAVTMPFHDHLYRSETAKSGHHHPEGAFWVRTPDRRGTTVHERVPLRSVAPTLLRLIGVPAPASMTSPPLSFEHADRATP